MKNKKGVMPQGGVPSVRRSKNEERRHFARFALNQRVYAANTAKPGIITDINRHGLGVRYIERKRWPDQTFTLDICIDECDFFLHDVPFAIASDQQIDNGYHDPDLVVKRMGIRFKDLSPAQEEKMEYLLRHFADIA